VKGEDMKIIDMMKTKANDLLYSLEVKKMLAKERWEEAKNDNRGIAVIEIILILVIVLGLIIIFRKNLKDMITDIFIKIRGSQKQITAPLG